MKRNLAIMACAGAVLLLGGCSIVRIAPHVKGTVVDASTGAPIEDAKVTIFYVDSKRKDKTGEMGEFKFGEKHRFGSASEGHTEHTTGFKLRVAKPGYAVREIEVGPFTILPHARRQELLPWQTHGQPMTWTGKSIVVSPIRLERAGATPQRAAPSPAAPGPKPAPKAGK